MPRSIPGTQTEQNLLIVFAGVSRARHRYTYYAGAVRKEGLVQIADIFDEKANQEKLQKQPRKVNRPQEAPKGCPTCAHTQAYFGLLGENW